MVLSEAGHLVEQAWRRSLVIRAEVTAGPWVVMPDHFHALAHIAPHPTPFPRQPVPGAGGRVPRSISTLIAGFKAASTGAINRHRGCVGARFWQAGFYDRMVRDTDAWRRIAAYIRDNPARWMA